MYAKTCAIIVLIQILSVAAYAAEENKLPGPQSLNPFQGTPEEQAACAPDATSFCKDAVPDTFRVLACLKLRWVFRESRGLEPGQDREGTSIVQREITRRTD